MKMGVNVYIKLTIVRRCLASAALTASLRLTAAVLVLHHQGDRGETLIVYSFIYLSIYIIINSRAPKV